MHKAMTLFNIFVNGDWFKHKPIILFLNKIDLLKKKLAVLCVSEHFTDFNGSSTDIVTAANYFTSHFYNLNQTPEHKIYIHYTNATDTTLLKVTMDCVYDIIVQSNLGALYL